MSQPILFMLLGYPGSGKTTVAKIIEKLTSAIRLTSDEERLRRFERPEFSQLEHDSLYKQLDQETERLLKSGKSVIYDANLNRYLHRAEKYEICQRTNARPVLIWLNTNRSLSRDRATNIKRKDFWPTNETPQAMFDRIANLIETPKMDENPIIINGLSVNKKTVENALSARSII